MFKAIVCLSMYRYAADYLDSAAWAKAHDGEELSPRQAAYEYMTLHSRFLTEQAYADACVSPELRALIKDLTEECRQALADRMRRCPRRASACCRPPSGTTARSCKRCCASRDSPMSGGTGF